MPCNCSYFTSFCSPSFFSWGYFNTSRNTTIYQVRFSSYPFTTNYQWFAFQWRLTALFFLPLLYRKISEKHDKVFATGCLPVETDGPRANAAFVVLARNKELEGVIQSIKSIERHFNRWFNYPYVFLNDGDFDDVFKETVKNYTSSSVEFGKIDNSMWGYPDWVDHEVAKEGIRKQGDAAIMYGGMESYHHMCRFYSGWVLT